MDIFTGQCTSCRQFRIVVSLNPASSAGPPIVCQECLRAALAKFPPVVTPGRDRA